MVHSFGKHGSEEFGDVSRPIYSSSDTTWRFPLGGVCTGGVSFGPRCELTDWQLWNGPRFGGKNGYSFFAIRTTNPIGVPTSRIIESQYSAPFDWQGGSPFAELAGLPRFTTGTVSALFPFAFGELADPEFPASVHIRAVTPFIPLDLDSSSLPLVEFRISVENTSATPLSFSVVGTTSYDPSLFADTVDSGLAAPCSTVIREHGWSGVELAGAASGGKYSSIALAIGDEGAEVLPAWSVDFWPDASEQFWTEFTTTGRLPSEGLPTHESEPLPLFSSNFDPAHHDIWDVLPKERTASVASTQEIAPGDIGEFVFVLAWLVPYRLAEWNGNIGLEGGETHRRVLNSYAERWANAHEVIAHYFGHRDDLLASSSRFAVTLCDSTIPAASQRSIAASLAALRTPLVFAIEDGARQGPVLGAWEGLFESVGSCEGSCTHVWSYAQTLAWVFPELERSARELEFDEETSPEGSQRFRSNALFRNPQWFMAPAVDGQLGTILRLYREWRFAGDDTWLSRRWHSAARALDFALTNWVDPETGLVNARVHNTYDIEFEGSEPLANSMLIAALDAGERLARRMHDTIHADTWKEARLRCRTAFGELLFNGEYFQQIGCSEAARHQFGSGVLSDQLLGQFHALVNGLEQITNNASLDSALDAIFTHNFVADLSCVPSTRRAFALPREAGLLLASWPHGDRPQVPFVYSDEVWTGIEHEVATLLLSRGRIAQCDRIESAISERYDGVKRNPWSEIECGRYYARSMSSWALLLTESGQQWDAPHRRLDFHPARPDGYSGLFITNSAWGRVTINPNEFKIRVLQGTLDKVTIVCNGYVLWHNITLEREQYLHTFR
ncbi:GH116 family glycosyl hydrolase [Actinomyces culturomici]|uniref:GH116 family glycosyl hydrolase n=1 Tax=Actinomyces culturomici TaxID=1926276 RepID=UPI000E205DA1|nr:GH116 family glycosyl hydrolase [Actinomyces culturomici]